MSGKRRWLAVGAVGLVALVLWSRLGSEERALAEVLVRASAALSARSGEDDGSRARRLEHELPDFFTSDVRVEAPELFSGSGRAEVARAAVALARGRHPILALSGLALKIDDRGHASATFRVSASESQAGDLHARTRNARASLVKTDRGWRIEWVVVENETPAEPEPRP